MNITKHFDNTVKKLGANTAVMEGDKELTFEALQQAAIKVADRLLRVSSSINSPVGVFLPKSINLIIADVGVMYSSNFFMNLDIGQSSDRLKKIVNSIEPEVVITNSALSGAVSDFFDGPIILIDTLDRSQECDREILDYRLENLIDMDPWCIINTSGSTGIPKGVTLSHRNYLNYTNWATTEFELNEKQILGVLSPPFFDHFNFELCLMMMKGAKLVLLENKDAAFPIKLLEVVRDQMINFIFWVPTIMVNIANLDLLSQIKLDDVKMIWFAGEVFPTKQFTYWRNSLPNATFVNLYGPTETTVDCTFYVINRKLNSNEPIPIGHACRNTNVFVLNENKELARIGEVGELYVRGTSLALGYYNNWEKTLENYIQNPLNQNFPELVYKTGDLVYINTFGELVYKGRIDGYIKHMGYRIELGELEHSLLNELELVKNCCALYDHKKKEIVLCYESDEEITTIDFRRKLIQYLPKYMVPTKFFYLSEMPRNKNGKIDRSKLALEFCDGTN